MSARKNDRELIVATAAIGVAAWGDDTFIQEGSHAGTAGCSNWGFSPTRRLGPQIDDFTLRLPHRFGWNSG